MPSWSCCGHCQDCCCCCSWGPQLGCVSSAPAQVSVSQASVTGPGCKGDVRRVSTQDQMVAPRWSRGHWFCWIMGGHSGQDERREAGLPGHPLFQVILIPQKGIKFLSFLPSLLSFLPPAPALSLPPSPPSSPSFLLPCDSFSFRLSHTVAQASLKCSCPLASAS